jgi:hypothetical protein
MYLGECVPRGLRLKRLSLAQLLGKGSLFPAILLMSLLAALPSFAQVNQGEILGTITDTSGGVIPNATVTITNTLTNVSNTLKTDSAGAYALPDLIPGAYTVRVSVQGFQTATHAGIELEVGKQVRIDVVLKPGTAVETVTVSGTPLVETTSNTLGGTLSSQQVVDLPLNGQDYENLVVLRPGVQRSPGGGFHSTSSNGLRLDNQNYNIDGIDNNDPFYGAPVVNQTGINGAPATEMPIDALQQFNVEEQPQANSGYEPGAVISLQLKSGTNQFHGDAYDFERNSYFDARNNFDVVGTPQTPVIFHQFGGTLGGPIVKDKLFFFVAYQGQRSKVGNTFTTTIPLSVSAGGGGNPATSVPDAEAGLAAQGLSLSPVSLNLLKLYPANTTGSTMVPLGFPNTTRMDNGVLHVDYHLTDRQSLDGSWFIGNSNQIEQEGPAVNPLFLGAAQNEANVAGGTWTYLINSRLVNQVFFGYTRFAQAIGSVDGSTNPTAFGINTGVTLPVNFGLPFITISGFTGLGTFGPLITRPNQNYSVGDNVSYVLGNHELKWGVEFRRGSTNLISDLNGPGFLSFTGNVAFPGSTALEDFLGGFPAFGQILAGGENHVQVSVRSIYAYMMDTYRVTPNLTANLGIRYEYTTPPSEANNLIANFLPSTGIVQVGHGINNVFQPDRHNFAPRVGIAWDLFGTQKTVLRAGGGIEYSFIQLETFLARLEANSGGAGIETIPTGALGVNPAAGGLEQGTGTIKDGTVFLSPAQLNYTTAGPVFGSQVLNCDPNLVANGAPGTPCAITGVNPNLKTPYVESWNLNIQQALGNQFSLEVGYVGNHGVDQLGVLDLNQPVPQLVNGVPIGPGWAACAAADYQPTSTACENSPDLGAEQAARPFNSQLPYLGVINQISNDYTSSYNSLQITATLRPWHGLSVLSGYTWGHALGVSGASADVGSGGLLPQNSLDPKAEYSNLPFDIRNRWTFALTYDIPAPAETLHHLLDGWQINSIVTLQSGSPFSANDSLDDVSGTAEFADRWDFFGKTSDFREEPRQGIPYFSYVTPQDTNANCTAQATALGAGALYSLQKFGCFAAGNSVLIPPAVGTYGTSSPNIFPGLPFKDWDFSLLKNFPIMGDRIRGQFRAEFFNILNHPTYANVNAEGGSVTSGIFGCGCSSPDENIGNPIIGTGSNRDVQLGLKILF